MRRTDSLGLFEYEVAKDGKQVFSIDQALNQNWEILDQAHEELKSYTDTNIETINETISSLPRNITLAMLPDWDAQPRSAGITYTASTFGWVRWQGSTTQDGIALYVNDKLVAYTEAYGTADTSGSACLVLVKPGDTYHGVGGNLEFYACNGI